MKQRSKTAWLILSMCALLSTISTVVAAETQGPPPALDLVLKPHSANGAVDYVAGKLTIEQPKVAAGGKLLRMPLVIVSIPTARYDGDALKVRDDAGDLPLTQHDEAPTPTGTYRQWLAKRASVGNVEVTFKAPPRQVSASTRTGPLFDLRADGGGILGAGITFLPLPDTTIPYRLHLQWDLTDLPAGSRGASGFGDGEIHTMGPAERLAFNFYAAGPLKSYPAADAKTKSNFMMYWLTEPAFDTKELATRVQKLYASMSAFFHDEGNPYRVFIRHNPHRSGGGTALPQSFMFGWNEGSETTLDGLQGLLSHEMTHNWPAMEGAEHGDTAWYSEGAAEFYSIVLSYRAGALTADKMLEALNSRASGYYTNPYLKASNTEAAKHFWNDWSAQRVPYGRGFMYLAQVDAKVRAKSGGKRSLDDLVREMFDRKRKSQPYGIPEWLNLVAAELGPEGRNDYDAMVAGKVLVPPTSSFNPCLKVVKYLDRPYFLGFDQESLTGDKKVVRGVVARSAAATAGLRDGDEVLESDDVLQVQKDSTTVMKMKVKRGGEQLSIEYLPRGAPIDGYRWERVKTVSDAHCRI